MNKRLFMLIVFAFSITALVLARGNREQPSEKTEIVQTDTVETGADTSEKEPADAIEYTGVQQKLADAGFQLPLEPFDAPPFTLTSLQGETISLAGQAGKLVFINFWASWCGPCKAEMPSMNVLYDTLSKEKFAMLAVNVNEPAETVAAFVNQNGYTFPILLDETGSVSNMYEVSGIPTTWLVGPEGKVLARLVGSIHWDTPEMLDLFELMLSEV